MLKEVDKAKIKYYNYDYIEIMGEYLIKKLVCSFMSLAMLVTMFTAMPLTAQAETYDTTIDGITYEIDTTTGEAEVDDADSSINTSNILSEVDGYKVTSIGADAFYYCTHSPQSQFPTLSQALVIVRFTGASCYHQLPSPTLSQALVIVRFINAPHSPQSQFPTA